MNNIASTFTMYGSREVLTMAGDAPYLKRQIELLESAIEETPELALDLARALIETVCKTILEDRGIKIEPGWLNSTPRLFENTLKYIALLPDTHMANDRALLGLEGTVDGLQKAVLGLCQIRNAAGIASHGKDGYTHPMDSLQALFAARAADSLVHFLYSAHKKYPAIPSIGRLIYVDNPEFNEFLDGQYEPVQIGNVTYLASEILYHVDLDAYREALIEYLTLQERDEAKAEN